MSMDLIQVRVARTQYLTIPTYRHYEKGSVYNAYKHVPKSKITQSLCPLGNQTEKQKNIRP